MEQLKILPQTVFKFECDQDLVSKTLETLKSEEWNTNGSILQTKATLHNREIYRDLHDWFHVCLNQVKDFLEYECDRLQITNTWANRTAKNGSHHVHVHHNSIVSGVFYLTKSNAGTIFANKNQWMSVQEDYNLRMMNDTWDERKMMVFYEHKSSPGDLIIFPSNMVHGTKRHVFEDNRYTISFNSFPCGKIGKFGFLNELELYIK